MFIQMFPVLPKPFRRSAFVFFVFLLICPLFLSGQVRLDLVHLKSGSVLKGDIIENQINDYIKLKTPGGLILQYPYEEIERLTVEDEKIPSPPEYKIRPVGVGILLSSVGAGGAVHLNLNDKTALEFNALSKGVQLYSSYGYYEASTIETAVMLSGSVNHFMKDVYLADKKKIKRQGVSFKAGRSFGVAKESFLSLNWIQENIRDKNQNNTFFFELGGGVIKLHGVNDYWSYNNGSQVSFLLNFKLHWNWYL